LGSLQDQALLLLAATFPGKQGGACGVLEHFPHALVCLGRALQVLGCADLLADILGLGTSSAYTLVWHLHFVVCFNMGSCAYLFRGDGLLRCLVQLLNGLLVVSQILLAADEDDGQAGAEVQDLGNPLKENDSVSVCSPRKSVTHDAMAP